MRDITNRFGSLHAHPRRTRCDKVEESELIIVAFWEEVAGYRAAPSNVIFSQKGKKEEDVAGMKCSWMNRDELESNCRNRSRRSKSGLA